MQAALHLLRDERYRSHGPVQQWNDWRLNRRQRGRRDAADASQGGGEAPLLQLRASVCSSMGGNRVLALKATFQQRVGSHQATASKQSRRLTAPCGKMMLLTWQPEQVSEHVKERLSEASVQTTQHSAVFCAPSTVDSSKWASRGSTPSALVTAMSCALHGSSITSARLNCRRMRSGYCVKAVRQSKAARPKAACSKVGSPESDAGQRGGTCHPVAHHQARPSPPQPQELAAGQHLCITKQIAQMT
jgi:hypothetical protein